MKKKLVCSIGVGAMVMVGALLINRANAPEHSTATKIAEVSADVQTEQKPPPRKAAPARRTALLAAQQLTHEAIQQETERVPSVLTGITENVLKQDPRLAQFYQLREKALRTKDEKRRYNEMLADPIRIEAAKEELLSAVETNEGLDQEEEVQRILQLKYLTAAADWADNPNRQAVFDAIAKVITAEFPPDMPREQRGSALGDKVELFQHLLVGHPEQAQSLQEDAKGTNIAPVLTFAENMLNAPDETAAKYH